MAKMLPAHYVFSKIGRLQVAVPLERVQRVLRMAATTPLPSAPAWLAGMLNLRGAAVPVAALSTLLGQPPRAAHPDDHLLLITASGAQLALQVDRVLDVVPVHPESIEPPPAALPSGLICAVMRHSDTLTLAIDPDQIPIQEEDLEKNHTSLFSQETKSGLRPTPGDDKDDLTRLDGLGPVYAHKLYAVGVDSFTALAHCDAAEILNRLNLPSGRLKRLKGWIDEARRLAQEPVG